MPEHSAWPEPDEDSAEARAQDLLGIGFLIGDGQSTLYVNDAATRLLGRSRSEILGPGQVRQLLHPDDVDRIETTVEDDLHRGAPLPERFTARVVQPDGSTVPVELWVKAEVRGDEVRTYTFIHEIGEMWAVREGLTQLALTDPLTGLPNRLAFEERLRFALDRLDRRPGRGLLVFCDLDDLKEINDGTGHAAGDAALVEFARRLSGALRTGDTAARMGGDEFVALLNDIEGASVPSLVGRLERATTFTLAFEGEDLAVAASIGWVEFHDASRSPRDLMKAADAAMYGAKQRRKRSR